MKPAMKPESKNIPLSLKIKPSDEKRLSEMADKLGVNRCVLSYEAIILVLEALSWASFEEIQETLERERTHKPAQPAAETSSQQPGHAPQGGDGDQMVAELLKRLAGEAQHTNYLLHQILGQLERSERRAVAREALDEQMAEHAQRIRSFFRPTN